MASQLCQAEGTLLMSWAPHAMPPDYRFGSGLNAPDASVLASVGRSGGIEFRVLRANPLPDSPEPYSLPIICSKQRQSDKSNITALMWQGRHGQENIATLYPYGLVLAGREEGVDLINPKTILDGCESAVRKNHPTPIAVTKDFGNIGFLPCGDTLQGGVVQTIDGDLLDTFRIAAGTLDGSVHLFQAETLQKEITINISAPGTPTGVTSLRWHPTTHNVLAAATSNGSVLVLNPKSTKPLLTITDPHKRHNVSGCCWLEATRNLVVSYDDPQRGVVQLWDLRHTSQPYREESATHAQGIVGLEMCGQDPRFFTTASREGRCVTWAMSSSGITPYSEVLVSDPIDSFAVSQSGPIAAVSVQSTIGSCSVHALDCALTKEASSVKTIPAWMKHSTGIDFGFPNKIVWFNSPSTANAPRTVTLASVCADQDFVMQSEKLQAPLESNDFGAFCDSQAEEARDLDPYESEVWRFLRLSFYPPQERQARIQEALGYSPSMVAFDIERFLGHPGGIGLITQPAGVSEGGASPKMGQEAGFGDIPVNPQETESFFNQLAHCSDEELKKTDADSEPGFDNGLSMERGEKGYFVSTDRNQWSQAPLSLVREAFLIGQPMAAIEVAIKANRWAEALILAANCNDTQVMRGVTHAYLEFAQDPFVMTLGRAAERNYAEIVRVCALDQWKEAAAVLATYVLDPETCSRTDGQWNELCRYLGNRLENEAGDLRAALLVYLLAGAFTEAIAVLSNMPSTPRRPGARALKLVTMRAARSDAKLSSKGVNILSMFIDKLVNTGQINLANRVLFVLEAGQDCQSAFQLIKFRIAEASGYSQPGEAIPFETYDIKPAPNPHMAPQNLYGEADHQPQNQTSPYPGGSMGQQAPMVPQPQYGNASSMTSPPYGNPPGPPQQQASPFGKPTQQPSTGFQPWGGYQQNSNYGSVPPPPTSHPPQAGPYGGMNPPPMGTSHPYGQVPPPPTTAFQQTPPSASVYPGAPQGPPPPQTSGPFGMTASGPGGNPPPTYGATQPGSNPPGSNPYNPSFMASVPPPPPPSTGFTTSPPQTGAFGHTTGGFGNNPPPHSLGTSTGGVAASGVGASGNNTYGGSRPGSTAFGASSAPSSGTPFGGPQLTKFGAAPPPPKPPSGPFTSFNPSGKVPPPPAGGPPTPGTMGGPPGAMGSTTTSTPAQPFGFQKAPGPYGAANSANTSGHQQPDLSSRYSTHPAAGVANMQSGLPTPWPIPTETQQRRSTSITTEHMNQQVQQASQPSGAPCPPVELGKIQQGLSQLLDVRIRAGEAQKRVEEINSCFKDLSTQLQQGQISREVQSKLVEFCNATQRSDWIGAMRLQQEVSKLGWNKNTKQWIMALKRVVQPPAQPAY